MTVASTTASQTRTSPINTGADKPGAGLAVAEDLLTITIDEIELQVPKGTLIIRAAELVGIAIPRFCDHPLLEPVGACRQCLVEVTDAGNGREMPKPQASCTIEVANGMKVKTQLTSPVADKAQRGQIEFLLINHPLDCPVCDKGGECPLQNQSMSTGAGETRFNDVKRTFPKPISISSQILLDRERCILCARCTRFSEQIAGDPFIAMAERGALQQVAIYEREPFESYFSGNTIQICPVGALTSAAYRFRSRPFDLVSTPSIAEHDAAGASIRVDHRRGEVLRRQSGDDPDVNEEWISDKDRFAFRSGHTDDRVTRPLIRDTDGSFRPASWPEALDVAVAGLKAAASTAVLTGGRLTIEDAYAYSKFARVVLGTNNIDFRSRPLSVEETDFLGHAVAGTGVAHGAGISADGIPTAPVTFSELEVASAVLLVGLEPEDECPTLFLRLRKAYRKHKLATWTLAPYLSPGGIKMGAGLVPTAPGAEADELAHLPTEVELDDSSVILVGERTAQFPGALTEALELVRRTGARLAWVPRRAGDRGAVEAGCLPTLLPGGRPVADAAARVDTQTIWGVEGLPTDAGLDAEAVLTAAAGGALGALVVAGVEPADFADPGAALAGFENAGFLVSLEQRFTAVSGRADVILPVCLTEEKAGAFWNWEGRERPFGVVIGKDAAGRSTAMSDLRVLAALAEAMGSPLGFRTAAEARAELVELGSWDGARAELGHLDGASAVTSGTVHHRAGRNDQVVLAGWRTLLDDSRSVDHEPNLQGTARRPVARLNPRTAAAAGIEAVPGEDLSVTVTGGAGSVTLPVELVDDMVLGTVWMPSRNRGQQALGARPGEQVTITPALPGRTPRRGSQP